MSCSCFLDPDVFVPRFDSLHYCRRLLLVPACPSRLFFSSPPRPAFVLGARRRRTRTKSKGKKEIAEWKMAFPYIYVSIIYTLRTLPVKPLVLSRQNATQPFVPLLSSVRHILSLLLHILHYISPPSPNEIPGLFSRRHISASLLPRPKDCHCAVPGPRCGINRWRIQQDERVPSNVLLARAKRPNAKISARLGLLSYYNTIGFICGETLVVASERELSSIRMYTV